MIKIPQNIKKIMTAKKTLAVVLDELQEVASEFAGTKFELFIEVDPEDGEKTLMLRVISSDIPQRKLDKQLRAAMLPVFSKSVRAGLPVIHTFEPALSEYA
jgi:hypothetical protein